jgi:predicted membrane protein
MEPIKSHPTRIQGVVFALLIITAGVLLLLFNAGYLPMAYKPVIFSWQMFLISLGVVFLCSPHKRIAGIVLSLLGLLLLAPKLHIDGLTCLRGNGWAIGLIVGGVLLLCRVFGPRLRCCNMDRRRRHFHRHFAAARPFSTSTETSAYLETECIFSGSKEKITSQNFKGGEINCIFGGAEIDFMDAQLAEGENTLSISAVFGGVTLYIPAHWNVELRQSPIFGRFEDKRVRPTFDIHENRTLIIKVSAVFGGGEIKTR